MWWRRPGVILGIIFTGLNPFFILWWLTVGSTLISQALVLVGTSGVVLMYASHVLMDYAWLAGTAVIAGRGQLLLGKWFRAILVIFGGAMDYFGVSLFLAGI